MFTFTPLQNGNIWGLLAVAGASFPTQRVNLGGSGRCGASGELSFSPASLDVGNQLLAGPASPLVGKRRVGSSERDWDRGWESGFAAKSCDVDSHSASHKGLVGAMQRCQTSSLSKSGEGSVQVEEHDLRTLDPLARKRGDTAPVVHAMTGSEPRESDGSLDSARSGWLLVLPWSLDLIGGVNVVVKNLIHHFRSERVFSPLLLVTSAASEAHTSGPFPETKSFYFDVWGPWDPRHPVRALVSFMVRLPLRCWRLRRIVKQWNLKIINPHFPGLGSLTFLILKKFGQFDGKLVLSFHGSDMRAVVFSTGLERRLWKILLRGADHIVVVSKSLGQSAITFEPKIAGKIRTIPNGVDIAMFASGRRDHQWQWAEAMRKYTVVSVGAFNTLKGHDVLLRAFSLVVKEIGEGRLLLIGATGPEIEKLRQLIDSLSLGDRVEILRDVPHEQIPTYLAQAMLFVLASRAEGFGMAAMEAGAAGLPVICTRATGLRELITDGVTGRLVEIDDHRALAGAIVELLRHPEEARRLAANLFDFVKHELTWQRTYQGYLEVLVPVSPLDSAS